MNKQMANIGRKLTTADMKKMLGGGGPGVGGTVTGLRCNYPAPPRCDVAYSGNCCTCCLGPTGDLCRLQAQQNPACWVA